MDLPRFIRIRQRLPHAPLPDVWEAARDALSALGPVPAGASVAITAGSRGIPDIGVVLKACVEGLRGAGAHPFVVASMGSHGGATAEGQLRILEGYGLTEAALGCPVAASMETAVVGESPWGPIPLCRLAVEADAILVVGRVKPHTSLTGPLQSGLTKMLLIGLGSRAGAERWHRAFRDASLAEIAARALPSLLRGVKVLGGLALIEDAGGALTAIEGVRAEDILSREPQLLDRATEALGRLPFDALDLLVVDEMGKDISGLGLDSNVVGRKHDDNKAAPGERPRVRYLMCRSLTPGSHGNGIGIGMVDFAPQALLDQVDLGVTRINALTSGHLGAAKLPLVYETERAIFEAVLPTLGGGEARIAWIRNTLELEELECAEGLWPELRGREGVEMLIPPRRARFDGAGRLTLDPPPPGGGGA